MKNQAIILMNASMDQEINNTKKTDGQILVIILLVMSILSIYLVAMVSNTRSNVQQTQSTQVYDQFYAIGEKKIALAQPLVGDLQTLAVNSVQAALSSDSTNFPLKTPCSAVQVIESWGISNSIQCTLTDSSYDPQSNDLQSTTLSFADVPELDLSQLSSGSNTEILLNNGTNNYTGSITLYWNDVSSSQIDWIFTLGYVNPASTDPAIPTYNVIEYSTLDETHPQVNILKNVTDSAPYTVGNFQFNHGVTFNIGSAINGIVTQQNITSLFIKPLIGNGSVTSKVSFAIKPSNTSTFPAQFRRITSVTNSSSLVNTGSSTPTVVLYGEYPLGGSVNPLLDYVYRGKFWQQNTP